MNIDEILKIENFTQKVVKLHQFCNQHYQNWTETERLLNAVLDLESDVMNGGFIQYLENKDMGEWHDAMVGLGNIGAKKSTDLLEKAKACYHNNEFHLIEEIDQEFFKYEDNIEELVISYAEKNKRDFGN